MGKIENRDIIIVGPQGWDYPIGTNSIDLAKEFSKSNRVLYINKPLDWTTRIKNRKRDHDFIKKRKSIISGRTIDCFKFILLQISMKFPQAIVVQQMNKRNI